MHFGGIAILDFGSQFTQLIARRLRELNVYCEIFPFDAPFDRIAGLKPKGVILSGGPSSVHDENAPHRDLTELLKLGPLLGVCYGMQLMAHQLGGSVKRSGHREYGLKAVSWTGRFGSVPTQQKVWMSHGDTVEQLPPGFRALAKSETGALASMQGTINGQSLWGVQFHPEVTHTEHGVELLKDFVFQTCTVSADWTPQHIVEELLEGIRKKVGPTDTVLCALSGGVDSTVTGVLLTRALGAQRVKCFFVDHGLLRKNEFNEVLKIYERLGLNVKPIHAADQFLVPLQGVKEPEQKRKIIGREFLRAFEAQVDVAETQWLAQGTLYPDVIESVNLRGASVTIKTHHNVGGLPKDMKLKLVEPLRELFKDEVRRVGSELGIPGDILWRHPFPGPGLAIRIIGEVTPENIALLQDADLIFTQELKASGLYEKIWQAFCVLLPIHTVGVQGDSRSYEKVLALRAVTSFDGMTADWFDFPADFIRKLSNRVTNEVKGINRVVYDVTSKPPGTIEWE
ncbi:MAG: glutamine-hydrolyzing GMP synthase [Bdellovibrionales bacterium]|nr:glutamine-hydrolyzing GMP synthase [Bdellovibrionales bacterium]